MELAYDQRAFAVGMTLVSSSAAGLGGLIVVNMGNLEHGDQRMIGMLNFSLGVMLYISFADILANSITTIGSSYANLAFFSGMIGFLGLTWVVPEADITKLVLQDADSPFREPPKARRGCKAEREARARQRSIAVTGILTAIGMSLHNIPEGVAVYITCLKGVESGLPLGMAMMLHNIPEGIAVAAPIYLAYKNKWMAIKWAFLSGLFEVLGALILECLLIDTITPFTMEFSLSVVAGVMVVLCFVEIVPESYAHVEPKMACLSNIAGMLVMFIGKFACESAISSRAP